MLYTSFILYLPVSCSPVFFGRGGVPDFIEIPRDIAMRIEINNAGIVGMESVAEKLITPSHGSVGTDALDSLSSSISENSAKTLEDDQKAFESLNHFYPSKYIRKAYELYRGDNVKLLPSPHNRWAMNEKDFMAYHRGLERERLGYSKPPTPEVILMRLMYDLQHFDSVKDLAPAELPVPDFTLISREEKFEEGKRRMEEFLSYRKSPSEQVVNERKRLLKKYRFQMLRSKGLLLAGVGFSLGAAGEGLAIYQKKKVQ